MALLVAPSCTREERQRAARYLRDADLDLGDVQVLADALVRQSREPDAELVRHLVACVGPHARTHIPRSKSVATLERLLDAPALDRHARVEVLKALAEVAEVHDVERLLARTYRSDEERSLVGAVAQSVLRRPLFVRRLSPSAFEDLVCRVLDARERRAGRTVRFRVCGRPYDRGVDGRGSDLYATGADDLGETLAEVQCKNAGRVSMRDLLEFDTGTTEAREREMSAPRFQPAPVPRRVFATAANPPDADAINKAARDRDIEFITGPELVGMVKEFLGREVKLSRA
jgi:hypothetical protein